MDKRESPPKRTLVDTRARGKARELKLRRTTVRVLTTDQLGMVAGAGCPASLLVE